MIPNESSDLTAANLVALRNQPDALRVITERLKVKEMGPADHIRTKHEVKAFIETGSTKAAGELLKLAQARLELNRNETIKLTQQRGQRIGE